MTDLIGAFLIGLVSAGHCLGMCGGLMVAAGLNSQQPVAALLYNLGRILTYCALGFGFGLFASAVPDQALPVLKLISALLLILTALHLLGLTSLLTKFETIGVPVWRRIQPFTKNLLPIRNTRSALILGIIWGFIPCGLIYTALSFSLSSGSALGAAKLMLAFGLGTFPAMLGVAVLATQLRTTLRLYWVRFSLACSLIILATVVGYQAFITIQ